MAGVARLVSPPEEITEDPAFARRLDRILALVEARLDQPVCVAGPGSLELMCALWRRGFLRVEVAQRRTCRCADELCELILISGHEVDGIVATVEAVNGMLRPGGRLAIITQELHSAWQRQRLCNLLAHRGFRYRPDEAIETAMIATKPELQDTLF